MKKNLYEGLFPFSIHLEKLGVHDEVLPTVFGCVLTEHKGVQLSVIIIQRAVYDFNRFLIMLTTQPPKLSSVTLLMHSIAAQFRTFLYVAKTLKFSLGDLTMDTLGVLDNEGSPMMVILDWETIVSNPMLTEKQRLKGIRISSCSQNLKP